ncbi:uncharacterized protein TRAVEDRAFT_48881 [Trametes versicolor FP-101664 SS1]|uniref:uncharacterized protein n=1 Tax=Trametes versicolor (strain FP-101664) TaxID=717944 RepID=UPI0004624660|nr:uncharacterized protein TRAVEDRAFT_48881 [Trametes versicolor FP-101664 SS1]EIW57854.1 hypothetical protein TRAVEDRAFT_48881 [Trametes versicolor FP-101664 SS1]
MSAPPTAVPFNPVALLPPVPPLSNTFGAFLEATFIGLIMHGITLHQTSRYFRLFPKDALVLTVAAASTFVLETIHIAVVVHHCYYYLVTEYFYPSALLHDVWSIRNLPVFTVTLIFISEKLFAPRGYLSLATAAMVEDFVLPTLADLEDVTWLTSAGFGVAILVDFLLAGMLVLVLQKSRTNPYNDVRMIFAAIIGLLTVIFGVLSLILGLVLPENLIYSAFNIIAAKLYTNTLLVVSGTMAQTWSVPRLDRGSGQMRRPSVNASTHPSGTMPDIVVDTERAVRRDAERIEMEYNGLRTR